MHQRSLRHQQDHLRPVQGQGELILVLPVIPQFPEKLWQSIRHRSTRIQAHAAPHQPIQDTQTRPSEHNFPPGVSLRRWVHLSWKNHISHKHGLSLVEAHGIRTAFPSWISSLLWGMEKWSLSWVGKNCLRSFKLEGIQWQAGVRDSRRAREVEVHR